MMLPSLSTLSALTMGLFALQAAAAPASTQKVKIQFWGSSYQCSGNSAVQEFTFNTNTGYQVYQLGFTYRSAMIISGVQACGIVGCQYGSSCYNAGTLELAKTPVCSTLGPGYDLDKILINTC